MAKKLDSLNDSLELKESVVENPTTDSTIDLDIDLSVTRKKRIRINGDNTKIVELNLSDMQIVNRMEQEYNNLSNYIKEVQQLSEDADNSDSALYQLSSRLGEIDQRMRESLDAIFDYPVSEVCAPDGAMYDPFDGSFRYEHIIEALSKLYENNLTLEFKKMQKKVNKTASKYIKSK